MPPKSQILEKKYPNKKKKRVTSWCFKPRAKTQTNWSVSGNPSTLGTDAKRKGGNQNDVGTLQLPMVRGKYTGEEV
jgi:hypothetical protein